MNSPQTEFGEFGSNFVSKAVGDPLSILVVEDDVFYLQWMARVIEKAGHFAICVNDGEEAIRILESEPIAIVISDLCMPNLDGIDLTKYIRSMNAGHYVHIIMVTGRDDEDDRRRALKYGVDDFITKGTNPSLLMARLSTACRMVRHEKELVRSNKELKFAIDRIKNDLSAATSAQEALLPHLHHKFAGITVTSEFLPSTFVSGDMFGCFEISDCLLGFYLVDVSGHGVKSSLMSVAIGHLVTEEYFRSTVVGEDSSLNPAALVKALNSRFCERGGDDYFTMICGVIDTRGDHLHYCQAGHPPPLLAIDNEKPTPLGTGGMPVGMFDFAEFENRVESFPNGSVLLVCSDAATEAENAKGEFFGDNRLLSLMEHSLASPVGGLTKAVISELNHWCQNQPLADDLTIIEINRRL